MTTLPQNTFTYGTDLYMVAPSTFSADEYRVVAVFTNATVTDGHATPDEAKNTALADFDSFHQALASA